MPGIYFIHTQTLPTIHPDIEAFITFRGTAVIDEEGNDVEIGKIEYAIHSAFSILDFQQCSIQFDCSTRSEDQKFLSELKDVARKKYAEIRRKSDVLS